MVQLSHPYMTPGKAIALTTWTFVSKAPSPYEYSNYSNSSYTGPFIFGLTAVISISLPTLISTLNKYICIQWTNYKVTDFIKHNRGKEAG